MATACGFRAALLTRYILTKGLTELFLQAGVHAPQEGLSTLGQGPCKGPIHIAPMDASGGGGVLYSAADGGFNQIQISAAALEVPILQSLTHTASRWKAA